MVTEILNTQSNLQITDSGEVFFLSKMNIQSITPVNEFVYIKSISNEGDVIVDWNVLTSPVTASPTDLADTLSGYITSVGDAGTGWASYVDTQYNVGSTFTIAQGASLPMPNNAGTVVNGFLPAGVSEFYDGMKIRPVNVGDCYVLRIAFVAQTSNVSGLAEIDLDIGGAVGQIFRRNIPFPKGANVAVPYTFAELVYSLDTFKANGGQLSISSLTGNTQIWNVLYTIARVHNAG